LVNGGENFCGRQIRGGGTTNPGTNDTKRVVLTLPWEPSKKTETGDETTEGDNCHIPAEKEVTIKLRIRIRTDTSIELPPPRVLTTKSTGLLC